jgi:hypothetical protein
MYFPCNADHRWREVQSMRDRTARRGSRREMARPTRDVKDMLARREFGDFKQRLDEGRCRMREAVSIDCSSTLPASMLEGTDCFGLSAHQEAPSLARSATVAFKHVYWFASRQGHSAHDRKQLLGVQSPGLRENPAIV